MNDIIEIEIRLTPEKQLFYGNDFGVYACSTEQKHLVKLNTYGNFVINGQMPQLVIDKEYKVKLKESYHKKYGQTYEVVSVHQELPTTIASQHSYLRSVLSESQAELLIGSFPDADIIGLIKNNALDYKSVKGIGKKTYDKIKEKIVDNFEIQEALVELSQYGITYKMIKKLIAHFNGSAALVVQKVKENPYVLCEVNGLGFLKVDEYALRMSIVKDSPYRIDAAIEYTLQQEESNGHCWIGLNKMQTQLCEITGLESFIIQMHSYDNPKFHVTDARIGFKKTFDYEKRIRDCLLKLIDGSGNFKVDDVEKKIQSAEEERGIIFTDEQRKAITESINNNVIIISGKAGTGKSTILRGIMTVLNGCTYETCAFSGKASQRIVESTGLTSKTIHRLLEFKPQDGFMYKTGNPLPQNIIVLDEASMVNTYLFYSLISAIEKGTKLIILGDTEQLPPIGAGNILKDMIESGVVPIVELTQVHRQALKSGILLAANHVREGQQITENECTDNKVVGELKDLYIIPKQSGQDIIDYIRNICVKIKNTVDIMDFQVIAPMKTRGMLGTKNLNVMLQGIFNPEDKPSLKRNGYDFKVGDKVIQCGNNYEAGENGIFNGTLGMIEEIDVEEKEVGIKFAGNDELVCYSQDDLDQIDMAYALTVHRTQGSQFKHVIFALDYASYVLLSRQLIYTALTRASEKCVLVCENKALRHAINKNDSSKRNTYLRELLTM